MSMRLLYILPVIALLSSCASQKTSSASSSTQYPVTLKHKITGNQLIVDATVTNNTKETVSLVNNRNFYNISVRALNPKKDEAYRPKIVTYGPVVSKEVMVVKPGHATTFSTTFLMRSLAGGPIEVERKDQPFGPRSYMVITDDTLKSTFTYEHYPRFLNERSKKVAVNFLTTPLGGQSTFRRPLVAPSSLRTIAPKAPTAPIKKPVKPLKPVVPRPSETQLRPGFI